MVYVNGWYKGKQFGRGCRLGSETWGKEGTVTWNQKNHEGPKQGEWSDGKRMSVGNSEAVTVSLQREQVLWREDVVIHKMNFLAFFWSYQSYWSSQVALVVKNPPANAGHIRDMSLIPGLGRSPGGGHGNPLQ